MPAGMTKQIQGKDGVHMVHAEVSKMFYDLQQEVLRLGKENSVLKAEQAGRASAAKPRPFAAESESGPESGSADEGGDASEGKDENEVALDVDVKSEGGA